MNNQQTTSPLQNRPRCYIWHVYKTILGATKHCLCCQCVGCCRSCRRSQQLGNESTAEEPDLLAGYDEGVQLVDSSSSPSSASQQHLGGGSVLRAEHVTELARWASWLRR